MPVLKQPQTLPARTTTVYPAAFAEGFDKRHKRALTAALGLTQFGVNLTTLLPGGKSALRHWHASEDEFIYVVSGVVTLVTEAGETELGPGAVAGFPAGVADGHQLLNRGSEPATYLEVGTRAAAERVVYPDVDLVAEKSEGSGWRFLRRSGEPYE